MKYFKKNKGITLIALIVTIVVLLILAGVTISQITGSESAMEKATEAREKDKQGTVLEAIKLAVVNSVASGLDGFVDTTALKQGLNGLIQESPEDVIIGDGPWVVTSTLGRVYEINKNSIVNELTGLVLTPNNLTLTIEGDTYEEKTITARLIDIEGTITWSDSTDKIDIIPSEDGMSATIKAKKSGTETITVNCSNGDTAKVTVQVINMIVPEVGDYIEYAVGYTGFSPNDGLGWRILETGNRNSDGDYENVKIISTNPPTRLYLWMDEGGNSNLWWGNEQIGNANKKAYGLINNFKNIPISSNSTMNSIEYNANIVNEKPSQEFNSETGAIFMTTKAKEIHNLSLQELNRTRYGDDKHDTNTITCKAVDVRGLFLANGKDFWLSTAYSNTDLYYVKQGGNGIMEHAKNGWIGLRPVITLNSPIYKDGDMWKIR